MAGQRIEAQRLNRRIAILRRGPGSDDGFGKAPGELRRLCWRFASVKPARMPRANVEGPVAGGTGVLAELSAWLRWDSVTAAILPTDKAVLDGKLYELTAVPQEVGQRGGIELLLVAADGPNSIDPDALPALK